MEKYAGCQGYTVRSNRDQIGEPKGKSAIGYGCEWQYNHVCSELKRRLMDVREREKQ